MTRATDFTNTLSCVCFVLAALLSASCDRGAPAPTAGEHGLVPVEESAEPNGATRSESAPAVGLQAELDALQSRLYKSELELAVTRTQLASSEARRMEREREWLEYSSLLGKVSPSRLPGGKIFAVEGAQSAPSAPPGLEMSVAT